MSITGTAQFDRSAGFLINEKIKTKKIKRKRILTLLLKAIQNWYIF